MVKETTSVGTSLTELMAGLRGSWTITIRREEPDAGQVVDHPEYAATVLKVQLRKEGRFGELVQVFPQVMLEDTRFDVLLYSLRKLIKKVEGER